MLPIAQDSIGLSARTCPLYATNICVIPLSMIENLDASKSTTIQLSSGIEVNIIGKDGSNLCALSMFGDAYEVELKRMLASGNVAEITFSKALSNGDKAKDVLENAAKFTLTIPELKSRLCIIPDSTSTINSRRKFAQFKKWLLEHYPDPEKLHEAVSLNTTGKPVRYAVRQDFYAGFKNNLSDEDALEWLREFLYNIDNYDVNDNQYMRRIVRYIPEFSTGAIMSEIVKRLMDKGIMKPISNGSNLYLIPHTVSKTMNGGRAAYVYDKSNHTVRQVSVNDIPQYQEQIINKYKQVQSTGDSSVTSSIYVRFFTQQTQS